MNLEFDKSLAKGYSSNSQIARILTEDWVKNNSYCPCCGNLVLNNFENNRPVADFFCINCNEEFELKSKNGTFSNTINDGAYSTMIERINSNQNPNFFFLTYSKNYTVSNYLLIPNHFFTPDIIRKRRPLAITAKRAGWVGCNIDISSVPEDGKIFIVKNNEKINKKIVVENYNKTKSLKTSNLDSRGWLMDILNCIGKIPSNEFSLEDIYKFKIVLQIKHPDNNFVKDKIRQQLQLLRDKGFIEFTSRGNYRRIR